MHLSLFREYLDLEFADLKNASTSLPFAYDLERIIDDFILLNIFVGNDFLPHLPGLHINEGALNRLFDIYKRILPRAGGYINEHGKLNVKRLQLVLNELTVVETEHFEHEFADSNWYKGKQNTKVESMEKAKARNKLVLTKEQRKTFDKVKAFVLGSLDKLAPDLKHTLTNTTIPRDRRFIEELAAKLRLETAYDEYDLAGNAVITLSFDNDLIELAAAEAESSGSEAEAVTLDYKGAPEWQSAINRVLAQYEKAPVAADFDDNEGENSHAVQLQQKMDQWKRDYYREKLEFDYSDSQSLHNVAYRYIEGLQWVLHYYYAGVASWSWFYDYHYAPKISDLNEAATYEFKFDLGHPFHPFEQLMGVLPQLSSTHIPLAFRDLLSDPTSPIIDFYPTEFALDLNGKKQDWEAIVKIPFIDEKRLLAAMGARASRLSAEENKRNDWGNSWRFYFDQNEHVYPSSLPGFFPDLVHCLCKVEEYKLPTLDGGLTYLPGLVDGVKLGKDAMSGFPSLYSLPFHGSLGFHGVNVFMSDSRKETMVISLDGGGPLEGLSSEDIARQVVGKRTFTGYPYLYEGLVTAVSDELFRYELDPSGHVRSIPQSNVMQWKRTADRLEYVYSKNRGLLIHHVAVIVHVQLLKGLARQDDGSTIKEFDEKESEFALQTTVSNVSNEDVRFVEQDARPIKDEFPLGEKVFFLGAPAYGVPAQVIGYDKESLAIRIAFFPTEKVENNHFKQKLLSAQLEVYTPSHATTRLVRMSGLTLSKITSSLMVQHENQKTNIGLNLKFEAKSQKVLGYSRKGYNNQWEFSQKAIQLIRDYNQDFPEIALALERTRDPQRATDFFAPELVDQRLKELKAWLVKKDVRNFEKVPLYSEQLDKQAVGVVEQLADSLAKTKTLASIKQAVINNIPRAAVLKSAHAASRLRDQQFALGDRVIMVADAGSVPLSAKGVVVGVQTSLIDVIFDVQFISGTTLGDRCSPYRGATCAPSTLLNLTNQQCVATIGGGKPNPAAQAQHAKNAKANANAKFTQGPRGGPSILPARGLPAGGFHPAHNAGKAKANGAVKVLTNPARQVNPTTSFGAVAAGKAPATVVAPAAPAGQTHQQKIQAALGAKPFASGEAGLQQLFQNLQVQGQAQGQQQRGPVPSQAHRGGFPQHQQGRGGFARGGGAPHPANGHQPVFTAAQRGQAGFRGGIQLANGGVGVPAPAGLHVPSRGRGGAHRGRGGPRGSARGGPRAGAGPVVVPAAQASGSA